MRHGKLDVGGGAVAQQAIGHRLQHARVPLLHRVGEDVVGLLERHRDVLYVVRAAPDAQPGLLRGHPRPLPRGCILTNHESSFVIEPWMLGADGRSVGALCAILESRRRMVCPTQ